MHLFIIAFSLSIMPPQVDYPAGKDPIIAIRQSCKQASSCEGAVAMWCIGYSRADGDGDGIPCENVCHSIKQVEDIKSRQGC